MARYCLDASFVLGWLIPAQRTAAVQERWLAFSPNDQLLAPPLLLAECTSTLHEQAQGQCISHHLARGLLQLLLQLPISLVGPTQAYQRAFEITGELGWKKAYDAVYIAVAELEAAELLTLDNEMHRGALRLSVSSTLVRS